MAYVTLIRPPTVGAKASYSLPVTPPIGIAYIAAALRQAGHDVQLIDALAEDLDNVGIAHHSALIYQGLSTEKLLDMIDPATQGIGVSSMFSIEWPHLRQLLTKIAERFPSVPIILGGEHPTATYDFILETCPAVTCIALGEGEETICDLAEFIEGKRSLDTVSSLAYRKNGQVVKNPPRARIRDVDSLPWPAWDLIPMGAYFDAGYSFGVDIGRSMPMLATRGCPYQCTFCSNPLMWTTRYIMRKPSLVLDEIEFYMEKYGATNIDFYDLTAIVKREWILDFCREIRRRGLKFTWQLPSGTRSEALDREVLEQLYNTGCRNLTYAPESGDPETLKLIKKKVKLNRMVNSMREAKSLGINLKCNLIIGFPHERRMNIYRTMAFMMKIAWIGVDDSPLFLFTPYPGTELFEYLRKKDRVPKLDDDYFVSLACYMDMSVPSHYCENVGPWELNLYRIVGMSSFYTLSYLTRPWRILRTLRNVISNRSETVFEQRILDFRKRQLAVKGGE